LVVRTVKRDGREDACYIKEPTKSGMGERVRYGI
jgi:hypothetical protein